MKKLFNLIFAAGALLCAAWACGNYDDSALRNELAALQSRVTILEEQMRTTNENISGLSELVNALNGKVKVNSVTETDDGWTITFSNGKTITVSKGGSLPIGIKKDEDNNYYWTLDGDWLLDQDGNKIPATGSAPQLTIENGYWLISYDGGETWTQLGPATGEAGEPGDSMFQWIAWDSSFWYFALGNGEVIRIGRGVAGVQAITAIPNFSNGAVEASGDTFTIRFAVLPEDAAAGLANQSLEIFKLGVVYTALTKASAGDEATLQISYIDVQDGKLLVTVDGSGLDDQFLGGVIGASAKLDIVYDENVMTSGYFPLQAKKNHTDVSAGDDLQAAINGAEDGTEVRVAAGVRIKAPLFIDKNIRLSGGWVDNFTRQDLTNRSIIDGLDKDCCVFSGMDSNYYRYSLDDVVLSGFEIRNGYGAGIWFQGKLTVEYCWIHNCYNNNKGGGIMNAEVKGDDLLLANSILEYNEADAHGGALSVSGNGTRMVVVNCLFRGNASIAQYGYTGAIHGQAGVEAYLCNNTIVENVNWRDGSAATSSPWAAVKFRNSGTKAVLVNNIIAGNWYFLPGVASDSENHPDRYDMPIKPMYLLEMQVYQIELPILNDDNPDCICYSNVLGGANSNNFIGYAGYGANQMAAQDACTFVANDHYYLLFVNPSAGNYQPAGASCSTGSADSLVMSMLGDYTTDLAGNPRVVAGKINAGCYQQQ